MLTTKQIACPWHFVISVCYCIQDEFMVNVACQTICIGEGNSHCLLISEPKQCHSGGSLYSSNDHCYKVLTTTQSWTTADAACTALDPSAHLAKIDSAALQSFLLMNVVTSGEVWTGLTDRNMEGMLQWADGEIWSSYPVVTASEVDCFSIDSAGSWLSKSCTVQLQAVCEYNSRGKIYALVVRWNFFYILLSMLFSQFWMCTPILQNFSYFLFQEVASVPTYVAGTAHLMTTPYSLTTLQSSTTPHVADRNIIYLFPGTA